MTKTSMAGRLASGDEGEYTLRNPLLYHLGPPSAPSGGPRATETATLTPWSDWIAKVAPRTLRDRVRHIELRPLRSIHEALSMVDDGRCGAADWRRWRARASAVGNLADLVDLPIAGRRVLSDLLAHRSGGALSVLMEALPDGAYAGGTLRLGRLPQGAFFADWRVLSRETRQQPSGWCVAMTGMLSQSALAGPQPGPRMRFDGEFVDGRREGPGTLHFFKTGRTEKGLELRGTWRRDKLVGKATFEVETGYFSGLFVERLQQTDNFGPGADGATMSLRAIGSEPEAFKFVARNSGHVMTLSAEKASGTIFFASSPSFASFELSSASLRIDCPNGAVLVGGLSLHFYWWPEKESSFGRQVSWATVDGSSVHTMPLDLPNCLQPLWEGRLSSRPSEWPCSIRGADGEAFEGEVTVGPTLYPSGPLGSLSYANGGLFRGGWNRGRWQGRGILVEPGGRHIQGTWHNGQADGIFTVSLPDGPAVREVWCHGQPVASLARQGRLSAGGLGAGEDDSIETLREEVLALRVVNRMLKWRLEDRKKSTTPHRESDGE